VEDRRAAVAACDSGGFRCESHFVLSVVRDEVDLGKITPTYGSELGQPPFNPIMMTALLLYAYCSGIYSSRRIAKAYGERVTNDLSFGKRLQE
jgi:transposase